MVICKMRRKTLNSLGVIALMTLVAGAQAQVTLTNKASFGVSGWLAPTANGNQAGGGNNTRGLAYDKFTNQLIVVNREPGFGNNLNLLDANTGTQNGKLSTAGLSGGTFLVNMVGVADDGKVYVSNLTTATGGNFKIYEFASATANLTGTSVYSYTTVATDQRIGDSFDVFGSGSSLRFAVGMQTGSATNGYHSVNSSFAGSNVLVAGTGNGDFKFGITFGATANDIFGTQGNTLYRYVQNGVLTGTASGGSLTGSGRLMDFAVVNGVSLLAIQDTQDHRLRVFDVSNPLAPVLAAVSNPLATTVANGNGVGQVKFGAINGSSATIYAMSANNGIQAFDVEVVPEPATMIVLAGAAAIAARRRRKNS